MLLFAHKANAFFPKVLWSERKTPNQCLTRPHDDENEYVEEEMKG